MFGAHVATAGGVEEAVLNAHRIGCKSFALFLKNQRRWTSKPYEQTNIDTFKARCKEYGYDARTQILPHGSYLINLGHPEEEARAKSYNTFLDDLKRCEQLDIGLYNLHPGSSLKGDKALAIKRVAENVSKALAQTSFVKVVLENMAGQGNLLGGTLEELQQMIEAVDEPVRDRVGVCIDTCHAFAAGYELRTLETFEEFWTRFDAIIGYERLLGMHVNDSRAPHGSNRDLHGNLGRGFLGLETFRLLVQKKELQTVPLILETPEDEEKTMAKEEKAGSKKGPADLREGEIQLMHWMADDEIKATDVAFLEKITALQSLGADDRQRQAAAAAKKGAKKRNVTDPTLDPEQKKIRF